MATRYYIAESEKRTGLSDIVEDLLNRGWELAGNLIITVTRPAPHLAVLYTQAMIKKV